MTLLGGLLLHHLHLVEHVHLGRVETLSLAEWLALLVEVLLHHLVVLLHLLRGGGYHRLARGHWRRLALRTASRLNLLLLLIELLEVWSDEVSRLLREVLSHHECLLWVPLLTVGHNLRLLPSLPLLLNLHA